MNSVCAPPVPPYRTVCVRVVYAVRFSPPPPAASEPLPNRTIRDAERTCPRTTCPLPSPPPQTYYNITRLSPVNRFASECICNPAAALLYVPRAVTVFFLFFFFRLFYYTIDFYNRYRPLLVGLCWLPSKGGRGMATRLGDKRRCKYEQYEIEIQECTVK